MVEKLLNFAAEKEIRSIYLEVWDKQEAACNLYRKLDFKKIGEKIVQLYDEKQPRRYIIMKKDLVLS